RLTGIESSRRRPEPAPADQSRGGGLMARVRFVLLLDAVHSRATPPAQQLAECRELVAAADQLGFEAIVWGQHFLAEELRYYQPVPYLAHLAEYGPRVRIVLGVILLSILNPVQVA